MGFKIWGNHCGPLHGEGNEIAIDKVDAACKKHDANYGRHGYFDLGSDLTLIKDQLSLQFTDLSLEQRLASAAITLAFIHTLPLSVHLTVARGVPDLLEGVAGQGARLAGEVKDAGEQVVDTVVDTVADAGNAVADVGKKAWNTVTSIF